MIRKIVLENYMSHARTELELAAGLTMLVGPNNCGKSAIVSALETLARNTAGDFMIRHGAKEARVIVETDDNHTLIWRRKSNGSANYCIDGRDVNRLKGNVPEDLHQFLKLAEVQLNEGDEPFDVHFGHQKSPIFLLNESERRAATFFSASSDAGRLLEIQDRHRDKVRDHRSARRRAEAEVARIDQQLEKLSPIHAIEPLLQAVEQEHQELIAEVSAIARLQQQIQLLESAQRNAATCQARAAGFQALSPPPAQEDVESFAALTAKTAAAGVQLRREIAQAAVLSDLLDPPIQLDPQPIGQTMIAIARAGFAVAGHRQAAEHLQSLREPPEMADPTPLQALLRSVAESQKRALAHAEMSANVNRSLRSLESEISDWLHDNPNCPVCGGEMTTGQLLESGDHVHA